MTKMKKIDWLELIVMVTISWVLNVWWKPDAGIYFAIGWLFYNTKK